MGGNTLWNSISARRLLSCVSYLPATVGNAPGPCFCSTTPRSCYAHRVPNRQSKKLQQETSLRPILQSVPATVYGVLSIRTHIRGSMGSARYFSSTNGSGNVELVYTAPLKGAVRAIKIFSLSTAVATFFGGPVLVWLGNPSVPLVARVMMSSVVMLVGLGTTALLHWLLKGG